VKDLALSGHYFRLAAEQGVAESQYRYGLWLLNCHNGHRDTAGAIHSLKLSADNSSPDGQFAIACIAENAIGHRSFNRSWHRSPILRTMLPSLFRWRRLPWPVLADGPRHSDGFHGCCRMFQAGGQFKRREWHEFLWLLSRTRRRN
jgi:TPR repeat protein